MHPTHTHCTQIVNIRANLSAISSRFLLFAGSLLDQLDFACQAGREDEHYQTHIFHTSSCASLIQPGQTLDMAHRYMQVHLQLTPLLSISYCCDPLFGPCILVH